MQTRGAKRVCAKIERQRYMQERGRATVGGHKTRGGNGARKSWARHHRARRTQEAGHGNDAQTARHHRQQQPA
eukprot:11227914-Lingulodinium_polyedra.AAC.1